MATNLKTRKPRQGARQTNPMSAGASGASGDGRIVTSKDNARAIQEAEQAQLLSFMAQLRKSDTAVEAAKAVLAEKKSEMSEIIRLAGIAGFKKFELVDLLKDTKAKRRDLTDQEQRRHRFRLYLGLPTGKSDEQLEMEERMPDAAKDEVFWRGDGYAAGLRGDPCKPPAETGVHGQAWMEDWGNGQKVLAERLAPKSPATAAAPEKELTRAELKAQEERAKKSLAELPKSGQVAGDPFEASPEELQGQVARRVLQEQRESAEEETEAV